jgi:ATP-binding protein involved in chromosome partitioning
MPTVGRDDILRALAGIVYPGFSRDLVAFGVVKEVEVDGGDVRVRIDLGPGNPAVAGTIERAAREAIERIPGVGSLSLRVGAGEAGVRADDSTTVAPSAHGEREDGLLPGVRDIVAVASGKGGVGKSTVAVNLAVALARRGARVGLLDADIYGPSIPLMMGIDEQPEIDATGRGIVPFTRFGVRFMSLGFLLPKDTAVIWRGPMVMKAIEQLLRDVVWGPLDVLVVDLPPGTGDAQLTLSQKVRLSGAVIVTTPQDVALADAVKGIAMFRKVGVEVLGVVENMSFFLCPHCGSRTDVFSHGGGRREAERLGAPFLGEVPLDALVRDGGDRGIPIVDSAPDSPLSGAFLAIADRVREALARSESGAAGDAGGLTGWLKRGWSGGGTTP